MKNKLIKYATISVFCAFFISGCSHRINATDFRGYEVGELTRAESAQVISQQHVVLSSWLPFGLGPEGSIRSKHDRVSQQRRGITYFVKLDRTGETLAITQADDVFVPNGGQAWVQFGDRIRIIPKQ